MRQTATALGLFLVLALAAAGCGSGDEGSSAGTTTSGGGAGGGETLGLSETEWKIDPAGPSLDAAGAVTIHVVNDGSFGHALELEGNGVEEKTETLGSGDSADLTVDLQPGTYELYCPIGNHRAMGMEATLTVAGGGSGGTTTGDDSGDDSSGSSYG
jgi:plastocyanin